MALLLLIPLVLLILILLFRAGSGHSGESPGESKNGDDFFHVSSVTGILNRVRRVTSNDDIASGGVSLDKKKAPDEEPFRFDQVRSVTPT
jgi:hypothetical protein